MKNHYPRLLMLTCCLGCMSPGQAVTIKQLTERPLISDVKISPTGEYLALRVFQKGKHHIRFLDRKTLKPLGALSFPFTSEVGFYYWANNERIVTRILEVSTNQEAPKNYGELFAANYDGGMQEHIFGYRSGERQTGTHIRKRDTDYAWANIIDALPDDDRHVMISSTAMSSSGHHIARALLLDTYSGLEKSTLKVSSYAFGRFYTDRNGKIRLVTSERQDNSIHLQALPGLNKEWITIPESRYGIDIEPIAITDDGTSVYFLDHEQNDKRGLHKLSLAGEKYQHIYTHKQVDITELIKTTNGHGVYAVRVDHGYPSYLMLPNPSEEREIFRKLLKYFSGSLVSIRSRSRDSKFWVIRTETDTDPGSFYLFNSVDKTSKKLFDSMPDVNQKELSIVEPITFESFDGKTISGYFTDAKGPRELTAPLVVLVHGGPITRDYWGFNPTVQALATNGFSVLQINFRGSQGFGEAFEQAGYLQWGDDIQRDIIAGTRWAIKNQRADAGKTCIMGSSFGAYSAIQSATLAPDLFSCVVANGGIYDLSIMYRKGDIESWWGGDAYLEKVIGRNKEQLAAFSPVNRIAELRAPVLVAHGKQDRRAPFGHAKRLRKALKKHDKEYEWFVKGREAHGFYNNDNQVEYLQTAIKFLSKHMLKADAD